MGIIAEAWAYLYDHFTPFELVLLNYVIFTSLYFVNGFLYLILDLTHRPAFLYQYKIQKVFWLFSSFKSQPIPNIVSESKIDF